MPALQKSVCLALLEAQICCAGGVGCYPFSWRPRLLLAPSSASCFCPLRWSDRATHTEEPGRPPCSATSATFASRRQPNLWRSDSWRRGERRPRRKLKVCPFLPPLPFPTSDTAGIARLLSIPGMRNDWGKAKRTCMSLLGLCPFFVFSPSSSTVAAFLTKQ